MMVSREGGFRSECIGIVSRQGLHNNIVIIVGDLPPTTHPPRDNLPVVRRQHPHPTTRQSTGPVNDGVRSRAIQTLVLVLE